MNQNLHQHSRHSPPPTPCYAGTLFFTSVPLPPLLWIVDSRYSKLSTLATSAPCNHFSLPDLSVVYCCSAGIISGNHSILVYLELFLSSFDTALSLWCYLASLFASFLLAFTLLVVPQWHLSNVHHVQGYCRIPFINPCFHPTYHALHTAGCLSWGGMPGGL